MKDGYRSSSQWGAALVVVIATVFGGAGRSDAMLNGAWTEAAAPDIEVASLALRGVYFVRNDGQWSDETVIYGCRSRGMNIAFRESSLTMRLSRPSADTGGGREGAESSELIGASEQAVSVNGDSMQRSLPESHGSYEPASHEPVEEWETLELTITFPGSNRVIPSGADPQTAKFNYFIGDDESTWRSGAPSFGAVVYENLYDGVDLHVKGSDDDGVLKYEFHCAPGANYEQIRIHYDGIDELCVNSRGDLLIETAFGTLRDSAPITWQEIDGRREEVPARYELIEPNTCTIVLDEPIDQAHGLIIDPHVEWMVYVGGTDADDVSSVAVAVDGTIVMTGATISDDFEGRKNSALGSYDAFVLKFNPERVLEWMTYIGGSEFDVGEDIELTSSSEIFITGQTRSTNFAGRTNSFHGDHDAFVGNVNTDGAMQWMLYLGGSGRDDGVAIASADSEGVVLTGSTSSWDFEGRTNSFEGGYSDAFLVNVRHSGSLVSMVYIGGDGSDWGAGLAMDQAGRTWVTGTTSSADLPGRNNSHHGNLDLFVVVFDSEQNIEWTSYLGGANTDHAWAITVDTAENAIVVGSTWSTDFEGATNSHHGGVIDAVIVQIDSSGVLQWATYLGGSGGNDSAQEVVVDATGSALIAGDTSSPDFEGRLNAHRGDRDAFLLKVDSSGALRWMKYIGGSDAEHAGGLARDATANAFVAGSTLSTDFEARTNALHGGVGSDAFLLKFRIGDGLSAHAIGDCPGPISIEIFGATPNGRVALLHADGEVGVRIPPPHACAGAQTGLDRTIRYAGDVLADANGVARFEVTAPISACNRTFLQVIDVESCAVSNVEVIRYPLELSVNGDCPGLMLLEAHALPEATVGLLHSPSEGSAHLPRDGFCGGTQVGLDQPILLADVTRADAEGLAQFQLDVPPAACGARFVQAIDMDQCDLSNVAIVK